MKGKIVGLAVVFVLIALSSAQADTIARGETRGWFIDPGKTVTVFYYPDGRACSVYWKDNWFYWANNGSFTTINIFCYLPRANTWSLLYTSSLAPYYSSAYLPLTNRGTPYKFVLRNYRGGDIAYLRIR